MNKCIQQMREYASLHQVPIITDEGLHFLEEYIKKHSVKKILEIGTAIGYSAICMASIDKDIFVTTIERDENRYLEAIKNIHEAFLDERIHVIYHDALDVELVDQYDLIFIDAAKAQNKNFFEKFEVYLKDHGTIITDNMNFHGLTDLDEKNISSRNLRQLVRKVKKYKEFLIQNKKYDTVFYDVGDGLAVSVKK